MGQTQKSTMETRFAGLCERWMVASKLGAASGTDDSRLEPRGKRMMESGRNEWYDLGY